MSDITLAWAGLEKQTLSERTRAGMERGRDETLATQRTLLESGEAHADRRQDVRARRGRRCDARIQDGQVLGRIVITP
jgi:hypothetical protein